ncbi:Beta-galactosidase-1-like protein 2 [Hypsibius exemplaris]|uniref:Beta-galactosidase-1-like protein 2 n=1 Tax=Hypsibius exemplaris TaxID=2072580 RepID=A0A1W0WUD9_HYPEX|nr:Beta-galactosidase-1-like protein 2 [Hypsibius exemplaris]
MVGFRGYTYYKDHAGIKSGLSVAEKSLVLNGQPLRLISGTIHYFRVVPEYWAHRLLQLKACGCNCVETYIPWNLHEPLPGVFNFDGICDLRKFIEIAAELDLLVIFRPGPYICAEWEFGGLPSWLLHDPKMVVRTTYPPFMAAVDRFFGKLLPLVADLQFTQSGPIILVQIENEYGAYGSDRAYMDGIAALLKKHGIQEMLFTSDGVSDLAPGQASDAWLTVNEQSHLSSVLDKLDAFQPKKHLMVTEYWSGWFDHWHEKHHTIPVEKYCQELSTILARGASVNFYVFHGGTTFGFMNGANSELFNSPGYAPTITSYDYDCLVNEDGSLSEKWHKTRDLLDSFGLLPTNLPGLPENIPIAKYEPIAANGFIALEDLLKKTASLKASVPLSMEMLNYNQGYGQAYGFIAYETEIPNSASVLCIEEMHDRAIIFVNDQEKSVIEYTKSTQKNHEVQIAPFNSPEKTLRLTILVENMGRVNFVRNPKTLDTQRKGIIGTISLNGEPVIDWTVRPLELLDSQVRQLSDSNNGWTICSSSRVCVPGLVRFHLQLAKEPCDTFFDMEGWGRGAVFANGFNVGRYWPSAGPQKTLYVPAPLLRKGANTIVVFELHSVQAQLRFAGEAVLGEIAEPWGH